METRKRLLVIPAALRVIPVYIFLHELGHLLVMVACGDKILSFSIFAASAYPEPEDTSPLLPSHCLILRGWDSHCCFLCFIFFSSSKTAGKGRFSDSIPRCLSWCPS